MQVEIIATEELGDRSYLAHDGRTAVVIDPQRDLDRVEELVAERGLTVALVLETHVHNDYVTGGYALARRTGAPYVLNGGEQVAFDHVDIHDGDILQAGCLRVQALATPGHTDAHLAYLVTDAEHPDEPAAAFTGGSLLYGSVGRTDLVDPARVEELAHAQFRSAHRLAAQLADETRIYPTHGFGSFCSSGSASGDGAGTMGTEKARNDALTTDDEQHFVDALIANLTAYPAYYAQMAPMNRRGPAAAELTIPPAPVDPAELARRLAAGEWVIDLRDRVAYAADHLAGTVSIELAGGFATYVGWLFPWGTPLTLLGENLEQVAAAQRQLSRIGIEDLSAATGRVRDLADRTERRSYPCTDFAGARLGMAADDVLLDVRREDEFRAGHIDRAVNLPIHDVPSRLDDVPAGRVWIHCLSGHRASIAASFLQRVGRDVVVIDDDYEAAEPSRWAARAPHATGVRSGP